MSKVYYDGRRYTYREIVEYKGEKKRITGTSAQGRMEARKSFQRKVDEWEDEIDNRERMFTGQETLSVAMTRWYDMYKLPLGQVQNTIITDRDTMKQIFATELGNMIVSEIKADDIQKNLNALARIRSNSVIKKRYLMLNMFFKYFAVTRQVFNIMEAVKLPKSRTHRTTVASGRNVVEEEKLAYTDKQIQMLYDDLKRPFDKTKIGTDECGTVYGRFLLVILFEYLRYGEAAELRVKDVDFKKNVIHIRRQWTSKSREIKEPKYNSVRDVPIAKEIRKFLVEAAIGKRSDELLFRTGELNKNREYIPSAKDGHIRENVVLLTLHRAEERLGFERHTIHDLRHDGISMYVRRGLRAEDVSRFAGHKSVAFTMDRYYRHTAEISEEAMRLVVGENC
ncbi:MAG: tyrosine-type recombinase/integrase [Oliverpabstia sp.]|nr:tyrosine-type recombinase/integrase [Oliverpabstia sp.]